MPFTAGAASAVYTREQIAQFLEHINIPAKYRLENNPPCDYDFLKALHIYTISAIPYENLTLHYSPHRRIRLDPEQVFQKIVGNKRGRGGYCVENTLFFMNMLRGLGFRAFPVACRIRYRENGIPQGDFSGWVHLVIIVTLQDGARWTCDVAFGGDGPTEPIQLREGAGIKNLGSQDARLIRDWIPSQTERTEERKFWIYQCRNGAEKPWNAFYCFHEAVEWTLPDYDITNWYTGHNPESFQTFNAIVVKFLRRRREGGTDDEADQEVYGKRMLVNGDVKENLGGKTQLLQQCKTEAERVQALKEYFGIQLTPEEASSIKGFQTELK